VTGALPSESNAAGFLYTGCFTTLVLNCRRWFPRTLWSKKCPFLDGYGAMTVLNSE
jgi:hypothetical protein